MQECNLPQVSNCTEKRTIEFIKPYKVSCWCALRWLVRSIVANIIFDDGLQYMVKFDEILEKVVL